MTQPTLVMQNEPWFVPNLMKRGRRSLDRLQKELLQLQNGTVYLGHRVILLLLKEPKHLESYINLVKSPDRQRKHPLWER